MRGESIVVMTLQSAYRAVKFHRRVLSSTALLLMPDPTDDLLAARDGDPAAFERFVNRTHQDVSRLCRHLGDDGYVEDLVQDTYLRALRSLHTYRADSDGRTWILGIARRACADGVAAQQRSRRTELTRRRNLDPAGSVELELLLDELPEDQRDAFVLTQLLGYRYDEAAVLCDCPSGTIRSRVARARAALAELLVRADQAAG